MSVVASPLVQPAKEGFDVQDGSAIDRFEVADRDGVLFHRLDHDGVQPDRVGSIWRPGCEYALAGPVRVAARVYGEHVAAPLVQPGQHKHLAAFP
jgi:hypothetical protein